MKLLLLRASTFSVKENTIALAECEGIGNGNREFMIMEK